jgi:hypothetical protein
MSITVVSSGRQMPKAMTSSSTATTTGFCQPINGWDAECTGSSSRRPLIARSSAYARCSSVRSSGSKISSNVIAPPRR